jgi:sulfotransferase
MTQQLHFMIGLPRSGSTVLCALLNQNPSVYVTPTSPLLGYLLHTQEAYYKIEESIANPNFEQLTTICRAMMSAAWSHRPEPHIIDKHRGWGKNLKAVETVTGRMPKVIATTRDLPSVMASWLTLIKKYPYVFDQKLKAKGLEPTDENRMGEMWFNMTKDTMESLVMARQTTSDMIEVNYDLFMTYPREILKEVENFLGLNHYDYDFNKIEKLEDDNDLKAWGFPELHKIRPHFGKTSTPAIEVLGEDLYNRFVEIEKQYV